MHKSRRRRKEGSDKLRKKRLCMQIRELFAADSASLLAICRNEGVATTLKSSNPLKVGDEICFLPASCAICFYLFFLTDWVYLPPSVPNSNSAYLGKEGFPPDRTAVMGATTLCTYVNQNSGKLDLDISLDIRQSWDVCQRTL